MYDAESGVWSQSGQMASAVDWPGHAYDPLWGLVIAGGVNSLGADLDTVYVTSDGASFNLLTELPRPKELHCVAIVDEDALFVAGGYPNYKEAYLYRKSTRYVCANWASHRY